MASLQTYLDLISHYESGNQNVPNYRFGPGYTAQGYYQITNTNWSAYAPLVGIDTSTYPNAMSAPQGLQAQVAGYLLTQTPAGISNWANYNSQLASALSSAGLQTSGQVSVVGDATSGPLVDITGEGAATPTAGIMDQIQTQAASLGIDLTSPVTDVLVAAGVSAAVYLLARAR